MANEYKMIDDKLVQLTDAEQKEFDARNKAWADGQANRDLSELRTQRNSLLAQTDWVVIKEREEGGSVSNFADWKKYRQELRDITTKYKSLADVKWPEEPSS